MKARDVRAALQEDHDPKLVHALCSVAEALSAQQQEITALAELLDNMTNLMLQLGAVTEQATNAVDEIQKQRGN